MKRSLRFGLQRSDKCRFLKARIRKVIRSLFLMDLFFSFCLLFHQSCLKKSCFYENQRAVINKKTIPQGATFDEVPSALDSTFTSLDFWGYIPAQILVIISLKLLVLTLFLYQNGPLLKKKISKLTTAFKTLKNSLFGFSRNHENRELLIKVTALQRRILAQNRLSQQYDSYKQEKLEKISDLSRILIHSYKAGNFLSHCETLKLLKEIKQTAFSLSEKQFTPTKLQTIEIDDFLDKVQAMLHWTLIKNEIQLEIKVDKSHNITLFSDPFLLEILILGFLKSVLFYLYKGSKITLSVTKEENQVHLNLFFNGQMAHNWYPLRNTSFGYGDLMLTGKKIMSLMGPLKTTVSIPSPTNAVITLSSLQTPYPNKNDNVVLLKC